MTQTNGGYHEPYEILSAKTRDRHRALISLIEELEAVDWYDQRAEACTDPALKEVIIHNRDEEIEHAMMTLEWLRRTSPEFAEHAKTYLFSEGPITEIEERAKEGGAEQADGGPPAGSLGIGNLRRS